MIRWISCGWKHLSPVIQPLPPWPQPGPPRFVFITTLFLHITLRDTYTCATDLTDSHTQCWENKWKWERYYKFPGLNVTISIHPQITFDDFNFLQMLICVSVSTSIRINTDLTHQLQKQHRAASVHQTDER